MHFRDPQQIFEFLLKLNLNLQKIQSRILIVSNLFFANYKEKPDKGSLRTMGIAIFEKSIYYI
jgi:hypothetical protein